MSTDTELRINKISRCLYIYASIIAIGVLWNILDGEIENVRDFIRGIVRSAVMFYLAKTIWDLKKISWWAIMIASCIFSLFGVVAIVLVVIGGIALENTQLLFLAGIILPSLILLTQTFLLVIQKDVRERFVN